MLPTPCICLLSPSLAGLIHTATRTRVAPSRGRAQGVRQQCADGHALDGKALVAGSRTATQASPRTRSHSSAGDHARAGLAHSHGGGTGKDAHALLPPHRPTLPSISAAPARPRLPHPPPTPNPLRPRPSCVASAPARARTSVPLRYDDGAVDSRVGMSAMSPRIAMVFDRPGGSGGSGVAFGPVRVCGARAHARVHAPSPQPDQGLDSSLAIYRRRVRRRGIRPGLPPPHGCGPHPRRPPRAAVAAARRGTGTGTAAESGSRIDSFNVAESRAQKSARTKERAPEKRAAPEAGAVAGRAPPPAAAPASQPAGGARPPAHPPACGLSRGVARGREGGARVHSYLVERAARLLRLGGARRCQVF